MSLTSPPDPSRMQPESSPATDEAETAFVASQLTAAGFPAGSEGDFVVLARVSAGELLQLVDAARGLRATLGRAGDLELRAAVSQVIAALPRAER